MAKIFNNKGTTEHCMNGKLHREDGPAVEFADGDNEWWVMGQCHRVDGPAVELANGNKYWYLDGVLLTEEEHRKRVSEIPVKKRNMYGSLEHYVNGKLHREDGPALEHLNGDKHWYLNGERHRADGPAIELTNGGKYWFFQGKHHREDGPAVEYAHGGKLWYRKGQLHREDGPAAEYKNGSKEWYLDGVLLTEEEHKQAVHAKKPECFLISDEWAMEGGTLYYRYRDPHDGTELCDAYDITWIYYGPYQITIETDSGQLFLSRLAKNYVGLTCRSPDNEYTHPIRMKWKKLIKFLMNH